jgi:hypothetical protein
MFVVFRVYVSDNSLTTIQYRRELYQYIITRIYILIYICVYVCIYIYTMKLFSAVMCLLWPKQQIVALTACFKALS